MSTSEQDLQQTNPLLQLDGLIDYAAVRPEHVAPAVEAQLARVNAALKHAADPATPATWDAVVEPLEAAANDFGRTWGVIAHLQSVVDTPELRAAYNEALPKVSECFIRLSQNEALYGKYKAMRESADFETLSPVRRRLVERELRDFVLSGAALPEAERARVKEIGERLSVVTQKFSENLLDATNAYTLDLEDDSRLKGIPADTLALYRMQAGAAGRTGYRVTLQFLSLIHI